MHVPSRKPGKRQCLRCGRTFRSRDVTGNRICPKCNELNANTRLPRQSPDWIWPGEQPPQSLGD